MTPLYHFVELETSGQSDYFDGEGKSRLIQRTILNKTLSIPPKRVEHKQTSSQQHQLHSSPAVIAYNAEGQQELLD